MTTIFEELREKLKKLEALHTGAMTDGERAAAGAAKARLISKLEEIKITDQEIEMNFHFNDMWQRKLFTALCRRYNLNPYRYHRQKYTTVVVKAPKSFINEVLWPEYEEMGDVLSKYLEDVTDKIIREEIHDVIEDPKAVFSPLELADNTRNKLYNLASSD